MTLIWVALSNLANFQRRGALAASLRQLSFLSSEGNDRPRVSRQPSQQTCTSLERGWQTSIRSVRWILCVIRSHGRTFDYRSRWRLQDCANLNANSPARIALQWSRRDKTIADTCLMAVTSRPTEVEGARLWCRPIRYVRRIGSSVNWRRRRDHERLATVYVMSHDSWRSFDFRPKQSICRACGASVERVVFVALVYSTLMELLLD